MDDAPERLDRLLTQLLHDYFGALEPAALSLLRTHLRWAEVRGGQTLMQQGEPGDSMYLVIGGRLRAYVQPEGASPRMVREMGRGQVIGEMSLYTDEPRSATVVAIRDSVLVRLDKAQFTQLLDSSAQVSVALTRQIIQRLRTEHQPARFAAPVTIGLFPVTEGVALRALAERLAAQLARHGRVCLIDRSAVDDAIGPDAGADVNRRTALFLDEVETAHDFVLLLGDEQPGEWTRRCSRHCDELLLLADASKPPALHPVETEGLERRPPQSEAAEILVLLHGEDERSPRGTAAWLARRPVADHVHIRPTLARDMARLARLLSRNAVGLVLAGGGARGFAHLGVLRALQEHGVEIDCVGGTSMGSLMAALVAADRPLDELMRVTRDAFRINPTGDFNLLPLMSLIRGGRMKAAAARAIETLTGFDADVEDLWKNHFCIATNYSQAREEVLTSGRLRLALTASAAIPGALPPVVRDGDLLCDGGTFNNFPVDVMKARRGVGCVIGVDLSFRKPRKLEFDEVPGSWALLRDRLRPRKARRYKLPSLPAYLLNTTILYSMSRQREAQRLTDVHFNPPLDRVGLLEWGRFDSIAQQGYDHAREVLARPEVAARLKPTSS
jgi:NTE family protein